MDDGRPEVRRKFPRFSLALIQHTDCGFERLANPEGAAEVRHQPRLSNEALLGRGVAQLVQADDLQSHGLGEAGMADLLGQVNSAHTPFRDAPDHPAARGVFEVGGIVQGRAQRSAGLG